jgi:tRNA U55 pseudouridine synthase TruB
MSKKNFDEDPDHSLLIDHPAGVTVQFSRVTGERDLFGSSIPSSSWVSLRIYKAKLNNFYGRTEPSVDSMLPLIEVDMSSAQFAELITTMNHGMGVCGTMTNFNRKPVERFETPVREIDNAEEYGKARINEALKRHKEGLKELAKAIDESKLSNKAKEEMKKMMDGLDNLEGNVEFYERRIQESAERFTVQAKAEVEAHITHAITTLGIESLKDQQKLMLTNKKD